MEDRFNLGGKTAIVVGGGGGIGAAVTEALARAGAAVAFCDIDVAAVEATTARLDEIGARNLGRVADALVTTELDDFYGEFDSGVRSPRRAGQCRRRGPATTVRERIASAMARRHPPELWLRAGFDRGGASACPRRRERWQHRELHNDRGPSRRRRLRGVRRRQGRAHQLLPRARPSSSLRTRSG